MTTDNYPDDLPEEDRLRCVLDELVYGASYIELTDHGPRRVDPAEAVVIHE